MKSPITGKDMKLVPEMVTLTYKGREYTVESDIYLCEDSGMKISTNALDQQAIDRVIKAHEKTVK